MVLRFSYFSLASLLGGLLVLTGGCLDDEHLLDPEVAHVPITAADMDSLSAHTAANGSACWGQATRVFARMGAMGEHASHFASPRLGLRQLARALYDAGVIDDDTLQALGAFVASTLSLHIDACL